jgi:hypothetical protein
MNYPGLFPINFFRHFSSPISRFPTIGRHTQTHTQTENTMTYGRHFALQAAECGQKVCLAAVLGSN